MVNLKANPYYLSDEDIAWVESTITNMTDEEKVGQLFFQLTSGNSEEYLKELMEKYHLGGIRYNGMPGANVLEHNRLLQKHATIPVFIACNPEGGGDGACPDGTYVGSGIKIGATRNLEHAKTLGRISGSQSAAIGCNMAFAPVCDILYNWECTEVLTRSFGNDAVRVAEMSKAYLEGARETEHFACAAKHFPGNGQDFRDAHQSNNNNMFGRKEWMETYGHVYKTLIDNGVEAIMGGHIMMPTFMRETNPDISDKQILPATLCPEIMTELLRGELGFNGMVVTDASHMVGMTCQMKREDMLPTCINAGCDMFLFFNDPDEDFATMLNAYKTGIISESRMTEALTRILGTKAHMGLHKISKDELVPPAENLASVLYNPEYAASAAKISKDALTLVKYTKEGVLPLSPEKTKRVMIVHIKGADTPMSIMTALALGHNANRKTPAEILRDMLIEKGFDAFIYVSPIDKIKAQLAAGEKPDFNVYLAGKSAIADFKEQQDLVITVCD
ncbi:MAG: beta-hexosaminidase, partial [Agathobacter sp.]|nr:beta-hexosaminidase [Agathobacter sp.]